ncbi:DNA-binding LacI/PurR family transcriptional regulator [Catalinimonas alkaloidigena]|uniref:LacI family DNA-binding transcriptional regulator n=1 Tax=Catalinimonas alkaloidigena TaxID=1075417 RepID=UPI0024065D21|nr:LacI family DNA-binding transcriptional regulator [Catalinimonas alkaloidigena]MDF9797796.1 DNA-binding LacI/PurR family transcriptional regulator [Catalinimonas alkaloidigena]
MKKRVSITDIARALNVTPSTVSRALNGGHKISEKTRKKIIDLAAELGYRPNPFAKSLLYNKTYNIGLVIPEFTHHFFNKVLNGIESVTYERGYHLIICTSDNLYEKEKKSCQTLLDARVDGMVATVANNSQSFEHYKDIIDAGVPLVLIDRICEDIETNYVITDDFEGARQAVEHLISTDCRKIIYIKGPDSISTTFNRYMGYVEALKKHNIPLNEELVLASDDDLPKKLRALLQEKKVDAIFAFSDYLAYDALKVIREEGLSVPEDISVIGYADEPIATYLSPALSTVQQPAFDIGRIGASFIMDRIDKGSSAEQDFFTEYLPTKLVLRASTKKPV